MDNCVTITIPSCYHHLLCMHNQFSPRRQSNDLDSHCLSDFEKSYLEEVDEISEM